MVKTTYGTDILALYSVLFCYCLSSTKCELNNTKDPKVVGGTPVTNRSQFAYQALLLTLSLFDTYEPACGGTIISEDHVLTAAHCIDSPIPSSVQVVVGNLDLYDHKILKSVQEIYIHAGFKIKPTLNDIALLKILGGFGVWIPNVQPINLKTDITTRGDCILSGFGSTHPQRGIMHRFLMYAEVYIVDSRICDAAVESAATTICAAGARKGACAGDSGGPLVCSGKLVGVASAGRKWCGAYSDPALYTEVAKYLEWIKDHGGPTFMSANSTTSPASPIAPPLHILNFISLFTILFIFKIVRNL